MGTTWKLYDSDPLNQIGLSEVWQCITLLRDTAKVHRDRDFPPPKIAALARTMVDKINVNATGRNWMKANCRFNDDDPGNVYMDVVILYHLVQHRGHQWCVSVGFDQSLLPVPDPAHPKDPNDPANPYVVLARELSATIRSDLSGFIPPARQWCSIDDV
ncbi:MAG TPA: hypothetical protein VL475_09905, partial [Planctomycetaceae bacterium]|nr:hypothetical protein [Planctomycetaceae bacterium]